MLIRRLGPAVLAAAVVGLAAGCSSAIPGTPVAVPGQAGKPLAPANLVDATCRQYTAMDDATRREVIKAIGGKGNGLIDLNPDLWVAVASALCSFVNPGAPVRDVIIGRGIR